MPPTTIKPDSRTVQKLVERVHAIIRSGGVYSNGQAGDTILPAAEALGLGVFGADFPLREPQNEVERWLVKTIRNHYGCLVPTPKPATPLDAAYAEAEATAAQREAVWRTAVERREDARRRHEALQLRGDGDEVIAARRVLEDAIRAMDDADRDLLRARVRLHEIAKTREILYWTPA